MPEMRILTVRQPWAEAIISLGKDVENRTRNVAGAYRGPVAIHAGLTPDRSAAFPADVDRPVEIFGTVGGIRFGSIIGVVDLVDVHIARAAASGRLVDWAEHTKPGELCSPWAEWDSWHLELENPRALKKPIPFTGALGLRRLDDATRILIESELS